MLADPTSVIDFHEFFETNEYKKTRKKRKEKSTSNNQGTGNLTIKTVKPLTENQKKVFTHYQAGHNMVLFGSAGTGKTFLALYLAMKELQTSSTVKSVQIVRSAVASRDLGFMPGNKNEKMKVFESPYYGIFSELYGRGDAYDNFKNRKQVFFEPTSFMRGITLKDTIIVVDECQNMTGVELSTVLTRVGEGSKVILCGDIKQTDWMKDRSGLGDNLKILQKMEEVRMVEFTTADIVRSGFVKSYLIAKENLGL